MTSLGPELSIILHRCGPFGAFAWSDGQMVKNSQNSITNLLKGRIIGSTHGKQSQKRYMVSGSPCPLISFLDVSYSVSFVVRGQRPRRGR